MTRPTSSLGDFPVLPRHGDDPPAVERADIGPENPAHERNLDPGHDLGLFGGPLDRLDRGVDVDDVPLRVPRLAAAPLPITSREPAAFGSPMRTQILEVPMSQATRNDPGLDIEGSVAERKSSETIPPAVGAHEDDPIGKTKIDGPCLPPATLNETARLEQRANLLRGVGPKNANRSSKIASIIPNPPSGNEAISESAEKYSGRAARRSSSRPTARATRGALRSGSRTPSRSRRGS